VVARLLLAAALAMLSASAQAADVFAGKTISIYVGSAAGGGYDIYSRVIGRHLGRFIPGKPNVIVQNMPGAGGAKAAAFIANVAPRDGTAIGAIAPGVIVGPLLDERMQAQYDPTKLVYLATANNGTRVCVTIDGAPVKTFEDARRTKAMIGTGAEGDSTRDYANLHKNTSGAKFEIVTGYSGTPDITLAMERREVDGVCGWDWSSLKSQRADDIRSGRLHVIVQAGLQSNAELTAMGVPEIWGFIDNDLDRKATELIVGQQLFGRPFIAAPGTPDAITAILRAAFTATMTDPEFLADAGRAKLDIIPSDGDTVQKGVARIYAAPKEVIERARDAIRK
jgi:tripartite-type tricarboxylate transporter receptor subunit TctC